MWLEATVQQSRFSCSLVFMFSLFFYPCISYGLKNVDLSLKSWWIQTQQLQLEHLVMLYITYYTIPGDTSLSGWPRMRMMTVWSLNFIVTVFSLSLESNPCGSYSETEQMSGFSSTIPPDFFKYQLIILGSVYFFRC